MLATFFILRRFVQTWVFKGVCNDMFGEFMIEMDEQYLAYRGNYKKFYRFTAFCLLTFFWDLRILAADTYVSIMSVRLIRYKTRLFRIILKRDLLTFKFSDKHFWTHGYVMVGRDKLDCVPLFLGELAEDIFVCGKTINLLKLCCPEVQFLLLS